MFHDTPPSHMYSMPTPNPQSLYGPTTGGGLALIEVLPPGLVQMVAPPLFVQVCPVAAATGAAASPTAVTATPVTDAR